MELIVTEVSELTRRSRSLVVAHQETGLSRGLEYGERVLVLDGSEYRTAVVVDLDFDLHETHYRLVLGGRVPARLAAKTLASDAGVPRSLSREVSVRDVEGLLSGSVPGPRVPLQRQPAHRLLDR